jgi:hypothetical protein
MIRVELATRDFSLPQNAPNCFWGPVAHLFNGTVCSFSVLGRPGHEADLNLVQRLRITGAVNVPLLYATMAQRGKIICTIHTTTT